MAFQLVEGDPSVVYVEEHATHGSFEAGDPVKIETNGQLKLASAVAEIFGIAQKTYTGTAGTQIPVIVLTPQQVWSIPVDSATTPTKAHLGIAYAIVIAAGASYLDVASGEVAEQFVVMELDPRDTAAAGTRVLVRAAVAVSDAMGNVT